MSGFRFWCKTLLREKDFHIRQIRKLIFLMSVIVLISTITLGFFYNYFISQLISSILPTYFSPDEMADLSSAIPGFRKTILIWVLLMLAVNFFITIIAGTIITQKLGAPIYFFKKAVKNFGEGRLNIDIELKKGDEFKDLAEGLCSATSRIQLMVMAIKENVSILESVSHEVNSSEKVKSAIEGCHQALAYFETVDINESLIKKETELKK